MVLVRTLSYWAFGWCDWSARSSLQAAHVFYSALSGVPPIAQAAGALVVLGFPRSLRFPPGAPQTRAICCAATRSNSGAPTAPSQPRPLGWPIARLPAHPARLERVGERGERKAAFQSARSLRQERTACHTERTSASQSACTLRGAVWPGRGIGRAERDEEGAGFRSESSEPQANGYSSKPRASEGFAKAAAGRGRLTRPGYTTQKRSNAQPTIFPNAQPLARSVAHPKALSRNSEQLTNTGRLYMANTFFTAVNF